MKKYIYALYISLISWPLVAQQVPQLTNYAYTPSLYNPAYKATKTGESGLLYSKQLASFGEVGPQSYILNADASTFLPVNNLGLGLRLAGDKVHLINATQIALDFAYNLIPDNPDLVIALGATAGLTNQRFDFTDRLLNDVNAASLVPNATSSSFQFDGGPALYVKVQGLQINAVLPRLFSSDINVETDLLYDFNPHWIGNISYRIQPAGSDIAIEPILFGKGIMTDKDCVCKTDLGVFLKGYYQLDGVDRAWLGLGYRLNNAASLAIGAGATEQLTILVAADYNFELGMSIEAGLTYRLGEGQPDPLSADDQMKLRMNRSTAEVRMDEIRQQQLRTQTQLDLTSGIYGEAINERDPVNKRDKTQKAVESLQQAEKNLNDFNRIAQVIYDARTNSEQIIQQNNTEPTREVKDVVKMSNEVNEDQRNLQSQYSDLEKKVNSLAEAIGLNKINFAGAPTMVLTQQLQQRLNQLDKKPTDTRNVRVEGTGNEVQVVYQFPYDSDSYDLSQGDHIESLLDHIGAVVAEMKESGQTPTEIEILGKLTTPKSALGIPSGKTYDGLFGPNRTIAYAFTDLISNKTTQEEVLLKNGQSLSAGQLSALQLYSLKHYLSEQNISPDRLIQLSASSPESVDYSLEIELKIKYQR